jgi:hypothetical protein
MQVFLASQNGGPRKESQVLLPSHLPPIPPSLTLFLLLSAPLPLSLLSPVRVFFLLDPRTPASPSPALGLDLADGKVNPYRSQPGGGWGALALDHLWMAPSVCVQVQWVGELHKEKEEVSQRAQLPHVLFYGHRVKNRAQVQQTQGFQEPCGLPVPWSTLHDLRLCVRWIYNSVKCHTHSWVPGWHQDVFYALHRLQRFVVEERGLQT